MPDAEGGRRSPYQGLVPYDEGDAAFFFGREREARLITANLFASPLTLLYGASGVGKSSVLRAGVVHQMRPRDDLLVVIFNTWQGEPLGGLKQAVAEAAARACGGEVSLPDPGDTPLDRYLAACARRCNRRVMLLLDQFEEYSLYHPQDDDFAAEFPAAVLAGGAPVSFLVSLREDAFARLDRFEGRIPTLFDNYLRVDHLDRAAARDAIRKPVERFNERHALPGAGYAVEPALVEAVLDQVKTGQVIVGQSGRGNFGKARAGDGASESDPAADRIETPYLQLVMTRLWDKAVAEGAHTLRLKSLHHFADPERRLTGAENIVRTHLDTVMAGSPLADQAVAARIFHLLVTPSGTKIAHTVRDLADYAGVPAPQLRVLLESLSHGSDRILRPVASPPDRPDEPRYEIFHDRLAPAILDWRARYAQAQEKAEAEKEAARRVEDEKRRADAQAALAASRKRIAGLLALLALFAVAAAGYAMQQRAIAEGQRRAAVEQRRRAEASARDARGSEQQARHSEAKAVASERKAVVNETRAKTNAAEARKQAQIAARKAREAEQARTVAVEARQAAEKERRRALEQARIAAQQRERAVRLAVAADTARRGEARAADTARLQAIKAMRARSEAVAALEIDRLNREALALNQRGDARGALAKYEQALARYRRRGDRAGEAVAESSLGLLHASLGGYDRALAHHQSALALYERQKDGAGVAAALNRVGSAYVALRRREDALAAYDRALALYRRLGDRAGEADTLNNKGQLFLAAGNDPADNRRAIEFYDHALRIYKASDDVAGQAAVLNNLGLAYARERHTAPRAIENFEAALALFRRLYDRSGEAATLSNIGMVYLTTDDRDRALDYFKQAQELLIRTLRERSAAKRA
jgi:tetratricopeptide (TPR) repeat protein